MKHMLLLALAAAGSLNAAAALAAEDTTAYLQRQTQEMFDAVAPGIQAPWERNLDADVLYTDENGVSYTKAQMLDNLQPLPQGMSGNIKVTRFVAHIHGNVALTNYVGDETENYLGQILHAKYLTTDTWLKRPQGWRIIGSQTLAMQQDPPAVMLTPAQLDSYAGTYAAAADFQYTITRTVDGLAGQATGGKPQVLKAELLDVLFVPDQPRSRKIFQRDAAGTITGFASRREGRDVKWKKLP